MGYQINYFFSQRDEKIKEFKDILNPERVENSFSKTEETYNTNILRFVFKTIGQELKSDPVDKKGNLLAVLNHNDVAYRFINPKTIDVDTIAKKTSLDPSIADSILDFPLSIFL